MDKKFTKEEDAIILQIMKEEKGNITSRMNKVLIKLPNKSYSLLYERWKQIK